MKKLFFFLKSMFLFGIVNAQFFNGGNVGIGTTDPAYALDVADTINAKAVLVDGTPLVPGGGYWSLSGSDVFYNTGNVGIGTASPNRTLHVNGTLGLGKLGGETNIEGLNLQYVDGGHGTTTFKHNRWGGNFFFKRSSPDGERNQLYFGGAGHHRLDIYNDSNAVAVRFHSGGNSYLNGGNVGIGTSSPGAKLHVAGNLRANGTAAVGDFLSVRQVNRKYPGFGVITYDDQKGLEGGHPIFAMSNFGGVPGAPLATKASRLLGTVIYSGHDGTQQVQIGRVSVASTGDFSEGNHPVQMHFQVGGTGACCGATRMTIDGNTGNVGIGTASPTEALDVRGNIYSNSTLNFGTSVRQMINLWSTSYGIGIQDYTQYFRTGSNFAWFRGGSHNDSTMNPGGGRVDMVLRQGRLGIGTASPEKELEVNGDILLRNSTGIKQIYTWAPSDPNWRMGMNANPGFTRSLATAYVQFVTYAPHSYYGFAVGVNGGDSGFEIQGSDHTAFFRGKVGIGTANPQAKLHVNGGIKLGTDNPYDPDSSYYANENYIAFRQIGVSEDFIGYKQNTFYFMDSPGGGDRSHPNLVVGGNVGIRTSSPTEALDVRGNIYTNSALNFGTSVRQMINLWSTNYGIGIQDYTQYFRTGSNFAWFRGGAHNDSTINPGGGVVDMVLKQGNLGIGTTNPGTWKLAVNGKIRAKEVKVETSWSDFVFEEDYALPTLEEVESHIAEKGHLKDIPSAAEVEADGIFVGEMNAKLLQKIEELTLYLIEQNKTLREQQRTLQSQQAQNRTQQAQLEAQQAEIEALKAAGTK